MKALLLGAAVVVAVGASAANANPVYFYYSVNNGGFQLFGTVDGGGSTNFKSADNTYSITAAAVGTPFLAAPNFNTTSNTVSTNTSMNVIVSIVEAGLSTPNLSGFNVSFTNNNSTTPVTMTFGTVSSATGATPMQIASAMQASTTASGVKFYSDPTTPATYSIFETYAATFGTGGGSFTATINESGVFAAPSSVPEPATLALLGLGIAGVVAARRRRVS